MTFDEIIEIMEDDFREGYVEEIVQEVLKDVGIYQHHAELMGEDFDVERSKIRTLLQVVHSAGWESGLYSASQSY